MLRWIRSWAEPEVRHTRRLLHQANLQLDKSLEENRKLKQQNLALDRKVKDLTSDNRALHEQIQLLKDANDKQSEILASMERGQAENAKRLEKAETMLRTLTDRLIKMEAERGRWLDSNDL